MDAWPADHRKRDGRYQEYKTKGKNKADASASAWAYPLAQLGSLSAATLRSEKDRFEWSFLAGNTLERRLVQRGRSKVVFPGFPGARPVPAQDTGVNISQRADQGAHFLRTVYPDVDIGAELIREEIVGHVREERERRRHDPYMGNMVQVFHCGRTRQETTYIGSPTGQRNNELNISSVLFSKQKNTTLKPCITPVHSFETPIQQIIASSAINEADEPVHGTVLGVRTYTSTSFHEVQPSPLRRGSTGPRVTVQQLACFRRSDVGDRHIVDMLLPPSGEQTAIIVNDIGSVYASNIFQGSKLPQLVFSRTSIHDDGPDRTWRLSEGAGTGSCLLLHSDFTHLLDFRSQNSALDIFQVSRPGESLTSVKSLPDKHLLCLSTTRELLWLDVRQPGRPLLGVCHNRGFDRSLTLETRQVAGVSLTFLASHRNSLVTVYDVSPLSGHALGVNTMPYALPPAQIPDGHNLGRTFVQDPPFASSKDISLFQLSESSGLHVLNMRLVEDEPSSLVGGDAADIQQTSEACVSEEQTKCSPMDFGPLDMRDNAEVDLRSAYDVIFISEPKTETGDSTYDALDKMPYFWQEVDAPVEHMLTTYDIAFRSGPEPTGPNRSDLLTQSVLNSVRGHRAMVGGRIPLPQVIRGAPWHLDITPSLHRFDEDIHKEPADIEDALRRYDLSSDTDRSSQSRQMESAAREQLALDLFLSKDVFSSHQLLKPTDPDLDNEFETMSRAAQAMSLDESEPPPVRFGFLRPINRTSSNNYSNTETENDLQATRGDKLGTPLGVRLLLNEWEVGADSREYTYIDPYGSTSTPSQILRRNVKARQQTYGPEAKASAIDSNQPPRIKPSIGVAPPVIAATQPSVLERPSPPRPLRTSGPNGSPRPRMEIGSQRPRESGFAAVSQEFMASTQVLPGPHGGRPSMMKKKPARKRVGGF